MFSAGLTLERAIQALSLEEKHNKFKKILTEVGSSIRKGLNLSESLSNHPGVFNNLFVAMTKAGEVSGNLNEILDQLASYLENLDDTRRKEKGITSFSALKEAQKELNFAKAGHAGTLDPLATGILPIFFDGYTRLIDLISDEGKEYIAVNKNLTCCKCIFCALFTFEPSFC